jgi:hypothetical protein
MLFWNQTFWKTNRTPNENKNPLEKIVETPSS